MNQMGIPAGLQAVLNAANAIKPVSSTGQPTVAAQVMGAAEQAGMSDATSASRASLGPANQRLEDERMQDILQRLNQSRPAGIEGLPTGDTLQGFAEGGVVGFAGNTDGSYVGSPEEIGQVPEPTGRNVDELLKAAIDFLRGKGTVYDTSVPPPKTSKSSDLTPQEMERTVPSGPTAAPAPPPREQRPGTKKQKEAPAPAEKSGIASLTESDKRVEEEIQAMKRRSEEKYSESRPSLEAQISQSARARQAYGLGQPGEHINAQMALMKQIMEQQDAERATGRKRENMADLIAALSAGGKGGLASFGRQYAIGQQARGEQEERLRAQKLTQQQALFGMENARVAMQEAAARGDTQALAAAEKEYSDNKRAFDTSRAQMGISALGQRVEMSKSLSQRALKERELEQQAEANRIARENVGEARKTREQTALSQQYNTVLRDIEAIQGRIRAAHDKKHESTMMLAKAAAAGGKGLPPELKAQVDAANSELAGLLNQVNARYAPQLESLRKQLNLGNAINFADI